MRIRNLINQFSAKPKQLFLIDGLGALLSAFLLGVVLVNLEPFVGIPTTTLYFLASLPLLFAIYDFYCFWNSATHKSIYIRIIAFANLSYVLLSIGLAITNSATITYLGWSYITLEIVVLLFLIYLELQTAKVLEE